MDCRVLGGRLMWNVCNGLGTMKAHGGAVWEVPG
jgi:hypothetical protein